jgi:hypothetical protein
MLSFSDGVIRRCRVLADSFLILQNGGSMSDIAGLLAAGGFAAVGYGTHPPTAYVGRRHVVAEPGGGGILFVEGVSARQGFNLFREYGLTAVEQGSIHVPLPISRAIAADAGESGLLGLNFRRPVWLVGHSGGAAYVRLVMAVTASADADGSLAALCLASPMIYASGLSWPADKRCIVNLGRDIDGVCAFPNPRQVVLGMSLLNPLAFPDIIGYEQPPEQRAISEPGVILARHSNAPAAVGSDADMLAWASGLPGITTSSHPLEGYVRLLRAVHFNVEAAALSGEPSPVVPPFQIPNDPAVVPPRAREVPGMVPNLEGEPMSVSNPRFDLSYLAVVRRAGLDSWQVVWMDQVLSVFSTKASARILVRQLNAAMRRSAGARSQFATAWVTALSSFMAQSAVNDGRIVPPATVL